MTRLLHRRVPFCARYARLAALLGRLCVLGSLASAERLSAAQSLGAPQPKKEFTAVLPAFEQATLENGLAIYTYEDSSLPLVTVALSLRTGSAAEPPNRGGIARLAYRLLIERAYFPEADSDGPAAADLGAALRYFVQPDGAQLRLNVVAAQAERAVAVLARLVEQPGKVDARDLASLKAQRLAELGADLLGPQQSAEEQLRQLIYGPQHPNGHTQTGTPATLNAITPDEVTSYYGCSLFPQNVALVLTGQVKAATARQWASRYFGAWRAQPRTCQPSVTPPSATARTTIVAVARPGLVQSVIIMGCAMVPAGHPDEIALRLVARYLGTRSYGQLRVDKGFTYGVASTIVQNLYGGHYVLSTSVQADQTGPALSALMSQLFAVQSASIPTLDMINARVRLGWETVSQYSSLEPSAMRVARLFQLHQPLTWDQSFLAQLREVGARDAEEAAARYFNRDRMQIVVVGDPQIIRRQVEPLKLGSLRWLQPDGSLAAVP